MMFRFLIVAGLMAGCTFPSQAAVVNVTYMGTVNSGYDQTGVFGAANTDLTGDVFTVKYRFDTNLGFTYSSPGFNRAIGGNAFGNVSPSLGAIIVVNGRSVSIAGSDNGQIQGQNDGSLSQQYHFAQDFDFTSTHNYVYNYVTNYSGGLPSSITAPLTYFPSSLDASTGYFQIYTYNSDTSVLIASAYGSLTNSSLTIAPAVPEPSTWALMLFGFAGMGFLTSRKNRRAGMAAL